MLCGARGRGRGVACAARLLLHVNLLLMLFSGAGLVMAARLKWDPSLYVPLRAAAPAEYRAAAALLPAAALALALLAHAAALALAGVARRPLLLAYAALMSLLTLAEAGAVAWLAWRALAWLRSDHARELRELLEARDHLSAALHILGKWLPLPEKINELILEAESDLPCNGYAAAGAVVALLVLQPAAAALALLAARTPAPAPAARAPRARPGPLASTPSAGADSRIDHRRTRQKRNSEASTDSEKAPLRTEYRNGRLVVV